MAARIVFAALSVVLGLSLAPPAALADGDGASVGAEWCADYPPGDYGDRVGAGPACQGLDGIVLDPDTNWTWGFNYGNTSAKERHWRQVASGGLSNTFADAVDLVAFAGHGLGNNMHFSTAQDYKDLYVNGSDRMDLGPNDCEWFLAYTCNFLYSGAQVPNNSHWDVFGYVCNGLHLICGFKTSMTLQSGMGSWFSYYTTEDGRSVRTAWNMVADKTQPHGEPVSERNWARVFGGYDNKNEKLWGYGPVEADPPNYSASNRGHYGCWNYEVI